MGLNRKTWHVQSQNILNILLKIGSIPHKQMQLKWIKPNIKSIFWGLPWWLSGKESTCQFRECGFEPWSRKIPHGRGATKPVHHNYRACALEPVSHNYWAHVLQLPKPTRLEPVLHNKRSHRNEKATHHKEESPPLTATRESLRATTQRSPPPKKKHILIIGYILYSERANTF